MPKYANEKRESMRY